MNKLFYIVVYTFLVQFSFAQISSNRPQTPKAPFNYNTDSVEYDNADKTVHLGATLTYPKTKGPFAVAVMITGSGLQDRDETIFNHKPFAVIADYLTNRGIAVLRVDDRMIGKSKGDVKNATSQDFADDVITSINYLLTRKEIDKNKIGVIGHSEGGFIAPIVYTKYPKLAFIISLAGTGVSGATLLEKQLTNPSKMFLNEHSFNAYCVLIKKTLQTVYNNPAKNDSLTANDIKDVYTEWKKEQPDSILIATHANIATPEMYLTQFKFLLTPWMRYFIATEPGPFWRKVQCPVLALNGEKDIQVYAEENTSAIAASLQKANNKNVTIKIFPQLNHLFQHCKECTGAEYGKLEESFSPEVLDTINSWLQENILQK